MKKNFIFISFLLFDILFIRLTTNNIINNEDNEDYKFRKLKERDEHSNPPEILSFKDDGEGNKIAKSLLW